MSAPAIAAMRALAFGTVDGSLWAAAFDQGAPTLVIGGGGGAGLGRGEGLAWSEDTAGAWRLDGDGVALLASAIDVPTAPEPAGDDDGAVAPPPGTGFVPGEGAPELVRVTGTIALGGRPSVDEREIDCLGVRVTAPASRSAKGAPASARLVAGWLPDGAALGCLTVRARAAGDHGSDAAYATVFDPDRWIRVTEPRLSTTYDASGSPPRANLELWIGEGDGEHPRRAAGEVSAAGGSVAASPDSDPAGAPALQVLPLRCHSRGEDGAGVYALAAF
jgi:hypothetical protein